MDKDDHQLLLKVLDYQRIPYTTLSRDLRPIEKTRKQSVQRRQGHQVKQDLPLVSTNDKSTTPEQRGPVNTFSIPDTAENEADVNTYSALDIQVLEPFYQELWGASDGHPSDLAIPPYANVDDAGIRPANKEELQEFNSAYTENKSAGQTDETETLIDQLSDRIGTLQVGAGGHIRYYGPTSNFNLAQLPFPDVFTVRRTIRNDGKELLERLGLNKPISSALEDHLTKLYFIWQDPAQHVVNQHMFYLAKSRWEAGDESPYYSESLQNALFVPSSSIDRVTNTNCCRCALGAAFETRHHPTLITFPRSLAEFFADRAKSLLEIELDNPCVATVQGLAVLSSHDIGCKRDSRGWLYSGK